MLAVFGDIHGNLPAFEVVLRDIDAAGIQAMVNTGDIVVGHPWGNEVVDIVRDLEASNAYVDVHDPWVNPVEAQRELGFSLTKELRDRHYDAVIIAVAHEQFREMGIERVRKLCKRHSVVFDVKYVFPRSETDGRL